MPVGSDVAVVVRAGKPVAVTIEADGEVARLAGPASAWSFPPSRWSVPPAQGSPTP